MGRGWLGAAGAGKAGDRSVLGIDSRLMLYRLLCVGEWILGRWWSHIGASPCGHAYLLRTLWACLPAALPSFPPSLTLYLHLSISLTLPASLTLSHLPYLPHPVSLTLPTSPYLPACLPHHTCLAPVCLTIPASPCLPASLILPTCLAHPAFLAQSRLKRSLHYMYEPTIKQL